MYVRVVLRMQFPCRAAPESEREAYCLIDERYLLVVRSALTWTQRLARGMGGERRPQR